MLAEAPVTDVSLRELSRRVGLAKSNVLRYFESREAVFLESALPSGIRENAARRFKLSTMECVGILAGLVRKEAPALSGAEHFAGAALVIVGGLWPFANPTVQVLAAIEQLNLDVPHLAFPDMLREALTTHLAGVLARSP